MLSAAIILFVLALAAILGFGGFAASMAGLAKTAFVVVPRSVGDLVRPGAQAHMTIEEALGRSTAPEQGRMTRLETTLSRAALVVVFAAACAQADGSSGASDGASESSGASETGGPSSNSGPSMTEAQGSTDGESATGGNSTPRRVELGAAGDFVILAEAGISTVPTSAITGDIGISPAAASFITGFSLAADASDVFSTSSQVTGRVYAADYAPPTPTDMTAAIGDMELAFTDAAGRPADVTELGAGSIGGMTLDPGVYNWGTGLLIPTDVTLAGSATDVWVFQIAGDLTMESAASVLLAEGAVPENVFWQVAGRVDLGATAHGEGVFLTATSVTLHTGASVNGRLLAQTAIDIDGSAVVEP